MEDLLFGRAREGDAPAGHSLAARLLVHPSPAVRVKALALVRAFANRRDMFADLVEVFAQSPSPTVAAALLGYLEGTSLTLPTCSEEVTRDIVQACLKGLSQTAMELAQAEIGFVSAPSSLEVDDFVSLLRRFRAVPSAKAESTLPDNSKLPMILADVALLDALVLCHPRIFHFAKEADALLSSIEAVQSAKDCVRDCAHALTVLEPHVVAVKQNSPFALAMTRVLGKLSHAVNPSPTLPHFAIHLNRASTQEEYFRGNLKKTVISSSEVPKSADDQPAVLMRDLRNKIASDLGMSGSVDMFELVVAGKICGPDLPLHKVYERIWKVHARKKTTGGGNSGGAQRHRQAHGNIFLASSGVFSGGGVFLDEDDGGDEDEDDDDDNVGDDLLVAEQLALNESSSGSSDAPMVVTYRLCAVDGEATEDFVSELPDESSEAKPDADDQVTIHLGEEGLGALVKVMSTASQGLNIWPVPVGKKLVHATLVALEQCARAPANQKTLLLCGLLPAVLSAITYNADMCLQILDRVITAQNTEEVSLSTKAGTADEHLSWVLDQLATHKDPRLVSSLARLVPYLAIGPTSASELAARITQALVPLSKGVANSDCSWMLHAVEALSADATALRDALAPLTAHVAEVIGGLFDAAKQAADPVVLAALRLAKGLLRNHPASQALLVQCPAALRNVVLLEEVPASTVEGVGQAADALLEVLDAGTDETRQAIATEKRARLEAKKARALKNRENVMRSTKRQRPADEKPVQGSKKWMEEMEQLKEESGLVCVVCQEGYRSRPTHILAAYVYCKSVKLPLGSKFIDCGSQVRMTTSSTWAISSASSFVCIHPHCHDAAARADRANARAPKDEWEGAALRNGHVKCNNLLPLRGCVPIATYDAALHCYFERVDRETKAQTSVGVVSFLSFCAHDIRFLLLRVSFGENLSEDSNGGGLDSNLKLIVPLVQMGAYLLDSDKGQRAAAEQLVDALSTGQESADAALLCVLSVLLGRHDSWDLHRNKFASALMAQARSAEAAVAAGDMASLGSGTLSHDGGEVAGVRARARSRARSLSAGAFEGDQIPKVLRPYWVFFALVESLHRMRVTAAIVEDEFSAIETVASRLANAYRSLQPAVSSVGALRGYLGGGLSALEPVVSSERPGEA